MGLGILAQKWGLSWGPCASKARHNHNGTSQSFQSPQGWELGLCHSDSLEVKPPPSQSALGGACISESSHIAALPQQKPVLGSACLSLRASSPGLCLHWFFSERLPSSSLRLFLRDAFRLPRMPRAILWKVKSQRKRPSLTEGGKHVQTELRNVWGPATKPGLVLPDLGVLLGHCKFTTGGRAQFAIVAKSQANLAYRVSAAKNNVEQFSSLFLCVM